MKRVFFCVFIFLTVFLSAEGGNSSDLLDLLDHKWLLLYPEEDRAMVVEASELFNIPIEVLIRQDFTESTFNRNEVYQQSDGYYSIGYKQINVRWLDYLVENYHILEEPFNKNNEKHLYWLGCAYLSYLISKYDSAMVGLVAYNAGETKVSKAIETVPQRAWDYAYFIMIGEGRGTYYNRMVEFQHLIEELNIGEK
jgi:hypothetical protein